jgi:hypothetical protein
MKFIIVKRVAYFKQTFWEDFQKQSNTIIRVLIPFLQSFRPSASNSVQNIGVIEILYTLSRHVT